MIRGLTSHDGVLYMVQDDKLYAADSAGVLTQRGTLNSTAGTVDLASNLSQLAINDGSYLYVYTPTSYTFSTATGYTGGDRISFLDQRINVLERGTQKLLWSSLGSALTFAALDFKSAESSPDPLVSQAAFNSELVLLGGETTEIWNTSGTDEVYTKTSAAIDYGCAAAHSVQKSASTLFWLANDAQGQAVVLGMQGHVERRLSTRALEEKLEGIELSSATAFCYSDGGQSFYCLNVPALTTTWVYDETYSQWHERAEWNGDYSKWRPACHAFAYGKHYFGGGNSLYTMDRNTHTYGGDVKIRRRIAPVISSPARKRVFFPSFEIICERGTGANLNLRTSPDNGANWTNTRTASIGSLGQYAHRARFNRLGSGHDMVCDVWMTDNAPFNPVEVHIPL